MGSGGQRSTKKSGSSPVPSKATQKIAAATAQAAPATNQQQPTTPPVPPAPTPQQQNQYNLNKFTAMNGQARGQAINQALQGTAAGSTADWRSPFQKFINNSGYDDKPTVLSEDQFDKASGVIVYRTVNTGPSITAIGIANQIANEDNCLYNTRNGGQMYGKGLYTTPSITGSVVYGDYYDNKNTAVIQMKIKDDAKIINFKELYKMYQNDLQKPGSYAQHLQNMCRKADHDTYGPDTNARALYALSKGYTVVTTADGTTQAQLRANLATGANEYTTILNRGAVYMNKTTRVAKRPSQVWRNGWKKLAKNADVD